MLINMKTISKQKCFNLIFQLPSFPVLQYTLTSAIAMATSTERYKFDAILTRNVRRLLRVAGIDVLDEAYKPNLKLAFLWFLITLFLVSCVNTILIGDMDKKIECISYLAICLQGPTKLYTGIIYRSQYVRLMECCRNVYRKVERTESTQLKQKTAKFSLFFCRILNAQSAIVIIAGVLLISFPVFAYLVLRMQYVPILPVTLPFLDAKNSVGYWSNYTLGFLAVVAGTCGISPSDSAFLILVVHAYAMNLGFAYVVEELNQVLRLNSGEVTSNKRTDRINNYEELYHKVIDVHSEYLLYDTEYV